jgi:tetratricopeptide (TPR) repeat protein
MVFGLWHVLQLHELGRVEEAIEAWIALELPRSVELYRYLGLAHAYLATGQFEEAQGVLAAASRLQVDHPLLHYFRGVYLLGRSETASEWPDWTGSRRVIPAGGNLEVVPNTASMFRREARRELREALEDAISLCDETSLFPPHAQSGMWVEPTVRDFLRSVSALRYEAACHQLLGKLYLEQGLWETVERHLDAARAAGLAHVEGYLALGQNLEQEGRFSDAARVYLKAVAAGDGFSRPARLAFRSLGEAWGS